MSTNPLASIESQIRGVRRSITRWFLIDGLVRIAAAVLAVCALDFAIDYFFQMDRAQRGIMLVLMITAVLWVAWKWLFRPLKASITDEAILFEVSQRHPEIGDSILTSLEFARADWSSHTNVSQVMIESAMTEGGRALGQVSFSRILRSGKFSLNLLLLTMLTAIVALGTIGIFSNNLMSIWANRNLMLGDKTWPADFELKIDGLTDGDIMIPRGDTWPLTARVADGFRSLPDEVQIEFRTNNGTRRESMSDGKGQRAFVYRISNVVEPFSFRLSSGRVTTDWINAKLIDRPAIDDLSLTVTPPEYTGQSTTTLPPGSDTYFLLRGTSLEIRGTASKPLQAATLTIGEEPLPLQVSGNGFSATMAPEAVKPGAWQLRLVDQEKIYQPEIGITGLGTRAPVIFNVRQLADKAPTVKAELQGIGSLVLPSARLPFNAVIEDDYKITKVELEHAWRQDQSEDQVEKIETSSPAAATEFIGEANVAFTDALDLQPLSIPTASRLRIRLRAEDNDTVSGPNIGESTDLLLRVVTESELRNQFLLRERQQRQVFEDIAKRQDTLMTDCEAFLAETRAVESLTDEQRSALFKLQRRQKLVGGNVRPVVESLISIVEEAVNNRLPDEQDVLKTRLRERIITPMQTLRESLIPGATAPLDGARNHLDSPAARNGSLENATAGQRAVLASMNEILIHMVKNEKFQLAIIRLYEIQRLQNDLKKQTDSEKEAALKQLIDENQ
ncbi:MAG: hypothetical protein R3F19_13410 [Verrucomicrobiales bacterium]